ncbi:T9SS type A sorting domain-containing protein [uncultured Polaribacter sp.]|uniref:T9SS type A sorting domain-containing protein n=1 Tax=uncultured Polaribacter sp. TaxID=174711 RepID=UPI00262CEF87|nr:T9SS type A sorting domain-containing protein [uncultured Polaribacter sp.]
MKKNTFKFIGYTCVISIFIIILINKNILNISETYIDDYHHEEYAEDYEESEEEIAYEMAMEKEALPKAFDLTSLSDIELVKYNSWVEKVKQSNFEFSSSKDFSAYFASAKKNMTSTLSEQYSYANNTLTGVWDQKYLHMFSSTNPGYSEGGFRTDGSLYDPVNEEMFIVSFAGHIYKIDEEAPIKWSLRNQTKSFEGDKFNGVNLANGNFRLLNQKGTGAMEFSDDEGRTWIDANGAFFEGNANYTTLVTKKGSSKRIVAHGARRNSSDANAWYDYVYISTDYGLNYTTSSLTFKSNTYDVEILKPHSSRAVYLLARRISDSKLFVYKMGENDSDFNLIHQPTTTAIKSLDAVSGTTVNGNTHFYISYDNINIFYSGDEGATWTKKVTDSNTGRNIIEVHPTKPNIVFKGFVELWISTDYGVNWTRNKHVLSNNDIYVWDVQHFKTFDKEDGGFFTISGYDFGTYYSTTSEDWNSWISVSRGNPTIMCYDADTSEKYNRVYTANQDRGSQSFIDNPDHDITKPIPAEREANTDVLRVTIANNGESAWYWYYYGAIGRSSVSDGGNFRTVVSRRNLFPNWAATSMVASPNSSEDAVFIPWGNQLQKMTYNGSSVEQTLHSFVFPEAAHSFGYSNVNKDRWYVGLQSGRFMYSTDGGNSFSNSSYAGSWPTGENSHRKRRAVIATSPIDEATVYYAGRGNNFLISLDGGASFTNHNDGLDVDRVVDIEASPNGQFIFAACEFDGSWVYSVQQDKWFKMDGAAVPDAVGYTDVQFIEDTNVVRFATYGSGIIDFTLNEDFSTIFVAADNFEIQVTDETCQGKNGQLKIDTKYNHNYTLTVNGVNYAFTDALNIPNLEPGDYNICIGILNTSYQHCVTLEVAASSLLSAKTSKKPNSKFLDVEINSGTAPFTVFINNNKVLETSNTNFSIRANDGDFIEIKSKAVCEGKVTKVMGSLDLKAFPNPAKDYVEINLPVNSGKNIKVDLFSTSSKLLSSKQYAITNNKIRINLKDMPSGMYFLRLHLEKIETIKILKQ